MGGIQPLLIGQESGRARRIHEMIELDATLVLVLQYVAHPYDP
jgi:hypothetical protein